MRSFFGISLATVVLAASAVSQTLFVDDTVASGLSLTHTPVVGHPTWAMLPGAAVGDFNRDGWPDLYAISGGTTPDKLFINQGGGIFVDEAAQWGLTDHLYAAGACVGDFNRDGWLDIYVVSAGDTVNGAIPNGSRLYQNNGNGTFTDVAQAAGVAYAAGCGCSKTACWADYDHDGWLDLFVTANDLSSNPNRLYHNNQDGTFTDVTVQARLNLVGTVWGLTCSFTDFDGDRWPELFVAGDYGSSQYYVNDRDGGFTPSTHTLQDIDQPSAMGIATGDFDEDGDIDFHLSDIHWPMTNLKGSRLLINDGDHHFSEQGGAAGVNATGWAWGNAATDIDNDGLLDIIVTNGWTQMQWQNYPTKVFYNTGNMLYVELSAWCGLVHYGNGRGMIKWDPDQDGDEDILIVGNGEPLSYFRNDLGNGNAWLRVSFDTSTNGSLAPDGFGTSVRATVNGRTLLRQVDSSISHLSQHELVAHFGFGPGVTQVDELRIEWADGFDTVLKNVAVNQALTVVAPEPLDCSALVRGQLATLTLSGAQSGERVWFLSSLVGLGLSPPVAQLGGLRIDLLPPVNIAGNSIANADGVASLSANIPATVPTIPVYLQSVIRRGSTAELSIKSNHLTRIIQ